jgi:hypothetical protein
MSSWFSFGNASDLIATSDVELKDVEIFAFTKPDGLIGSMLGRCLKLRANKFLFSYENDKQTNKKTLRRARVDLMSLEAMTEIYETNLFDRAHLPAETRQKVNQRTGRVLRADLYPFADFSVESETEKTLSGTLQLHAVAQRIECVKELSPGLLTVKCPLDMRKFLLVPPVHFQGLLAVHKDVMVVCKVPTRLLD